MMAKYIIFEGVDKTGKSTQVKLVTDKLNRIGLLDALAVSEVDDTFIGKGVRELTLNRAGASVKTRFFMMCGARAQMYHEIMKPAIEKGKSLITDRSFISGVAYAGVTAGSKDFNYYIDIATAPIEHRIPDMVFLFKRRPDIEDIPDDELERQIAKDNTRGVIEEAISYAAYDSCPNVILVPTGGTIEEITDFIVSEIEKVVL